MSEELYPRATAACDAIEHHVTTHHPAYEATAYITRRPWFDWKNPEDELHLIVELRRSAAGWRNIFRTALSIGAPLVPADWSAPSPERGARTPDHELAYRVALAAEINDQEWDTVFSDDTRSGADFLAQIVEPFLGDDVPVSGDEPVAEWYRALVHYSVELRDAGAVPGEDADGVNVPAQVAERLSLMSQRITDLGERGGTSAEPVFEFGFGANLGALAMGPLVRGDFWSGPDGWEDDDHGFVEPSPYRGRLRYYDTDNDLPNGDFPFSDDRAHLVAPYGEAFEVIFGDGYGYEPEQVAAARQIVEARLESFPGVMAEVFQGVEVDWRIHDPKEPYLGVLVHGRWKTTVPPLEELFGVNNSWLVEHLVPALGTDPRVDVALFDEHASPSEGPGLAGGGVDPWTHGTQEPFEDTPPF